MVPGDLLWRQSVYCLSFWCVWYDLGCLYFIECLSQDNIVPTSCDEINFVKFYCELFTGDSFCVLLQYGWIFSPSYDNQNIGSLPWWEWSVPWTIVILLIDLCRVIMFTIFINYTDWSAYRYKSYCCFKDLIFDEVLTIDINLLLVQLMCLCNLTNWNQWNNICKTYFHVHQFIQMRSTWVSWCVNSIILFSLFWCYNLLIILLVICCQISNVWLQWDIYHIQMLWVHEWWGLYHIKKSEVRFSPVHCRFCIYKIQRMFQMQKSFFFMLITVKEDWSNHFLYISDVVFITHIKPWCIPTSSLYGCVKLINIEVSNICWFFQSFILINYRKVVWKLLIIQCFQDENNDSY